MLENERRTTMLSSARTSRWMTNTFPGRVRKMMYSSGSVMARDCDVAEGICTNDVAGMAPVMCRTCPRSTESCRNVCEGFDCKSASVK